MTLSLYAHPFSSYCQKVLIALYENATPFVLKMLGPETPENFGALKQSDPSASFRCWTTTELSSSEGGVRSRGYILRDPNTNNVAA